MKLRYSKNALAIRRLVGATSHVVLLRNRRGTPRIFCNSIQKAGTHLLVEMVSRLPDIHSYERGAYWHGFSRSRVDINRSSTLSSVKQDLGKCHPGELLHGHVEAAPDISEFLTAHQFKTSFIYRDPRDVVVSLLYWWHRYVDIDTWPYRYFHALSTDDERLRFLIEGWPQDSLLPGYPSRVDFPDIGARFGAFEPWMRDANCLSVQFEALRAQETREGVCRQIIQHIFGDVDRTTMEAMVRRMLAGADPRSSMTFRRGLGGEWRDLFKPYHYEAFKRCAGGLLVRLGYEWDLHW